eukprot:PITA_32341
MWVYFLKYKSDAFSTFQKFKTLVEKESGYNIMTLRTDNRGEFCSSAFSNFCDTHGIKRQLTTLDTPQQNNVVERRNRMVVEMARSMLQHPHSVLLPVGPLDGRDDAASVFDNTLPGLPPENNPPLAAPIVLEPSPPPPDIGSSTLWPKWWAKTIGDLRDNELLEGRTSRHKSKQQSTINFAVMAKLHSIFEPQTYSEAKGTCEWEQAMEAEFQSLQKNHMWTLSDLPTGKKPISCKWVYKVKYKADGTLDKYKARLVA